MNLAPRLASTVAALALLVVSPEVFAQTRPPAWGAGSNFAIGPRFLARVGEYALGGVGGQVRMRVHRLVNIELYSDHMMGSM
jgi:hypothetical protein